LPKITPQIVIDMAHATPQLKIYTFSALTGFGWENIAKSSNGKHYELTDNPTQMYNSLMEILDEICKSSAP
jgi:hypothetical protein